MYRDFNEQDLKSEIIELKKQLHHFKEENQLLHVKIRKQQAELAQKDEDIAVLIDPISTYKSKRFRQILGSEKANVTLQLTDRVAKLEKENRDKSNLIKKLVDQLHLKKIYLNSSRCGTTASEKNESPKSVEEKEKSSQQPYLKLNDQSLEKPGTDETNKNNQKLAEGDKQSLKQFFPHEEIQALQESFLDMFLEMKVLRHAVKKLEEEQCHTSVQLKEKGDKIEQLNECFKRIINTNENILPNGVRSSKSFTCLREKQHKSIKYIYTTGTRKNTYSALKNKRIEENPKSS